MYSDEKTTEGDDEYTVWSTPALQNDQEVLNFSFGIRESNIEQSRVHSCYANRVPKKDHDK